MGIPSRFSYIPILISKGYYLCAGSWIWFRSFKSDLSWKQNNRISIFRYFKFRFFESLRPVCDYQRSPEEPGAALGSTKLTHGDLGWRILCKVRQNTLDARMWCNYWPLRSVVLHSVLGRAEVPHPFQARPVPLPRVAQHNSCVVFWSWRLTRNPAVTVSNKEFC